MIGTSIWDYIFIRSCIFVLHSIAPLCIFFTIVGFLAQPPPFHVPQVVEVWTTLETLFYLLVFLPLNSYLQRAATHPKPVSRKRRRLLFRRCQDTIPNPERYLARWFMDAPSSEIRRENVKDFFRWAFLNEREADPANDKELEEYVDELERLLGRSLQPGRGNAKCLRLTLEKVDMLHRSLTWYLVRFYRMMRIHFYPTVHLVC